MKLINILNITALIITAAILSSCAHNQETSNEELTQKISDYQNKMRGGRGIASANTLGLKEFSKIKITYGIVKCAAVPGANPFTGFRCENLEKLIKNRTAMRQDILKLVDDQSTDQRIWYSDLKRDDHMFDFYVSITDKSTKRSLASNEENKKLDILVSLTSHMGENKEALFGPGMGDTGSIRISAPSYECMNSYQFAGIPKTVKTTERGVTKEENYIPIFMLENTQLCAPVSQG